MIIAISIPLFAWLLTWRHGDRITSTKILKSVTSTPHLVLLA